MPSKTNRVLLTVSDFQTRLRPHTCLRKRTIRSSGIAALFALSTLGMPLYADDAGHAAENLQPINVNDGFANLVEAVNPAVVNISVTGTVKSSRRAPYGGSPDIEEFFKRYFGDKFNDQNKDKGDKPYERKTTAVGSGFIIDKSGLVVTNNHVIADADEIEVVFDDGARIPAELKGTDAKTDLALLQIKSDKPFAFVKFGNSESARVGDWVVAIGNPFGLGGTTTKGIISARGRDIRSGPLDDFIQIDAPINRGNSGGPLFNMKGEVIGINSAIYSPNGGSVGIGFAIPSSLAKNVIGQLRDTGIVQRGYLGVQIQVVSDEIAESLGLDKARGALVNQVIEGSPAEAAGVKAGDVILEFNQKPIPNMRELPKVVALTATNKKVDIVVWRNEEEKVIEVSVGGNDDKEIISSRNNTAVSKLGMSLLELTDSNRERFGIRSDAQGALIIKVEADSVADEKGLKRGELIKKVGTEEVTAPEQVEAAIEAAIETEKKSALLLVEREARVRYVAIPLTEEG